MSYQFSSELITPEMAEIWLQGMRSNRPVSLSNVKFLADQIREGKWVDTGVPIVFVGENLIDGQHRLRAVIETKKTICNAIVRHSGTKAQNEVFPVLDTGIKRSASNVLHIAGYKNWKLLAQTLKSLTIWQFVQNEALANGKDTIQQTRLHSVLVTPRDWVMLDNASFLQMPNRFTNIEQSVYFGSVKRKDPRLNDPLTRAKWAFFHYMLTSIDSKHAEEFLDALHKGSGRFFTASSQPLPQLREFLIARSQLKQAKIFYRSISDWVFITLHVFSAWNATRGLGTYKASKLNESSPIPIPR